MRARFVLLAVVAVTSTLVFGACAYDWTFYGPGAGDGGSESGGGGRDSSAVDGGRTEDVSVPPPLPGECNLKTPCANGFCDYARYDCGQSGEPGKCVQPGPCPVGPGITERVCGCNGVMYTSTCEANAANQDLADDGRCNASALKDPALFQCGYRFCQRATELCVVSKASPITEYKCTQLCPKADCTCVTGCSSCNGSTDGGITAICP